MLHTRPVEKKLFTKPFIIFKISSDPALEVCLKMINYFLTRESTEKVYVEDQDLITEFMETRMAELKISKSTFNRNYNKIHEFQLRENDADICIVIGGDGTILWANHVFQDELRPPFLAFNLGTLGYMATYCCENFESILNDLLDPQMKIYFEKRTFLKGKFLLNLVNRRESNIKHTFEEARKSYSLSRNQSLAKSSSMNVDPGSVISKKKEEKIIYALNDITIERKDYSHMINTEIYYNDQPLTIVKSNGIIISTPTGSTAYSLSAGGTIIHYGVDCFILNSICPHSLSFRPIAFPRGDKLKIILCSDSKDSVVINDGINKYDLSHNQGIEVEVSNKHVDFILLEKCYNSMSSLWKQKIIDQLGWNNSFKNVECNTIDEKIFNEKSEGNIFQERQEKSCKFDN